MAFETPSLEENHAFLIAVLSNLLPGADISEGSFNWLWLRTLAAGAAGNDAHLAAVEDELLADTAVDNLPRHSKLVPGGEVKRKSATPARKANALRIVGTAATPIPGDILYTSTSGLTFRVDGGGLVGPGGYGDVDLVAVDLGSATRLSVGETLTAVSSTAGLEDEATLVLALDEDGDDLESIDAWRARILSPLKATPRGGTQEDYAQWAKAVDGIAAAYTYPIRNGKGTVDVAALHAGSGDVRALNAPEVAALQAVIDGKRPVTATTRALQITTTAVNCEYTYVSTGESQYAPDWDDSSVPTVVAFDPLTNILQFSGAALPGDLIAGGRVAFELGATGAERTVASLGPGIDQVTLEIDDAGDVPGVGARIFSGGPLVQPIRAAILALVNGLGTANPSKKYGAWEGSIRPKSIERVAAGVTGATDEGVCVLPLAIVDAEDPAFPDNYRIGLLIPGYVLVHEAF